jgi:hypothetical protein
MPEDQKQQIDAKIQQLDAKIQEVSRLYATLLSAAEIDPQIVRTLREILGGTTLSGLSDVDFGTLSNGQVLKYRSSDGKWYNGTDEVV